MGGIVRGIFCSDNSAEEYFEKVKEAVDLEIRAPNSMILDVDVEYGLQTKDIGAQNPFSHKIYHFEVDPNTFKTQKVIFASEWVRNNLDKEKLQNEYVTQKEGKTGSVKGGLYEHFVYTSWCVATTSMEKIADHKKADDNENGVIKPQNWRAQEVLLPLKSTPELLCTREEALQ